VLWFLGVHTPGVQTNGVKVAGVHVAAVQVPGVGVQTPANHVPPWLWQVLLLLHVPTEHTCAFWQLLWLLWPEMLHVPAF
jgi:hypothetical protein